MRLVPSTSTSCSVPTSASLRALRVVLDALDQPLDALALDVFRHLVVHHGRLRAGPGRVDERERVVEADRVVDLDGLGEVGLGLAREADDHVGGQRDVGYRRADAVDQRQVPVAVVRAAHALEDLRRAGLQRQVHVLARHPALGQRGDHVGAHVLGCGDV